MSDPIYLTNLNQVSALADDKRAQLAEAAKRFVFRSNDYYQSLINWSDPDDPIRRIIMPNVAELNDWGTLDASDEDSPSGSDSSCRTQTTGPRPWPRRPNACTFDTMRRPTSTASTGC
jgi:L-lysine 2,3-aminomutase